MNITGALIGLGCALVIAVLCVWEVVTERRGDKEYDDRKRSD